jgi:3-oxoacyl-[acyl-carrier protein] reductase
MTNNAATDTPCWPDLAGKVAVVTGGSRGIGAATAAALGAQGTAVAVVGRDEAAAEGVAKAIDVDGGRAIAVTADCTDREAVERGRDQIVGQLGPVDILVAFAGGYGSPVASETETVEHWRQVVEGNLTATFVTVATFLPDLITRHGTIITMASSAGRQATGASAAYAAAKAGIVGLSRHLAGELAHHGVRVNCLAPATVESDRVRAYMSAQQRQHLAADFPLGRIGQPNDVAAAACYLASDMSSWITGITLDIAGGKVMP